jgi:hypothetical protein
MLLRVLFLIIWCQLPCSFVSTERTHFLFWIPGKSRCLMKSLHTSVRRGPTSKGEWGIKSLQTYEEIHYITTCSRICFCFCFFFLRIWGINGWGTIFKIKRLFGGVFINNKRKLYHSHFLGNCHDLAVGQCSREEIIAIYCIYCFVLFYFILFHYFILLFYLFSFISSYLIQFYFCSSFSYPGGS